MWFVVWLSYSQYQLSSVFCVPKLVGIPPHTIDVTPIRVLRCAVYKNFALNWLCFYSFKPTVLHVHVFFLFSLLYILSICLSTVLVNKCVHNVVCVCMCVCARSGWQVQRRNAGVCQLFAVWCFWTSSEAFSASILLTVTYCNVYKCKKWNVHAHW